MDARILLVDDELMLRQTLKPLLERHGFTVVAEASDGREAIELACKHRLDAVVLEIDLPRMNGLRVAREVIRSRPSVGVILLTRQLDQGYVLEALRDGVRGFVLKSQPADDLARALKEVCAGGVYVGPSALRAVVQLGRRADRLALGLLSLREREVLLLVARGMTTKQIAGSLNIRSKTADFHRARLMRKLDIHDTAGLVRYAIRHGVIAP